MTTEKDEPVELGVHHKTFATLGSNTDNLRQGKALPPV